MSPDQVHRCSHLLTTKAALEQAMAVLLAAEPRAVVPLDRPVTWDCRFPLSIEVEAGDLLVALGNRMQAVNEELEAMAGRFGAPAA